jgi:hypothetical protein
MDVYHNMSDKKNVEYDEPYDQEDYKTFSSGENGEMGCKTCGAVFCEETFDKEDTQHHNRNFLYLDFCLKL